MSVDQLPSVAVLTLMNASGVRDSPDPMFGIHSQFRIEDRASVSEVLKLTRAELVRLRKGQAFARSRAGVPGSCACDCRTAPAAGELGPRPRLFPIWNARSPPELRRKAG